MGCNTNRNIEGLIKMKAAIYNRVSTEGQEQEGTNLQTK